MAVVPFVQHFSPGVSISILYDDVTFLLTSITSANASLQPVVVKIGSRTIVVPSGARSVVVPGAPMTLISAPRQGTPDVIGLPIAITVG